MAFRKRMTALVLSALMLACLLPAGGLAGEAASPLQVKDGMLQPFVKVSDPISMEYSNKESEILRYCVWVETDHDTDMDGKADLVKVLVQVPRAAAEGKYKAGVIYDPTPYNAGTLDKYEEDVSPMYVEEPFNYADLEKPGEKRTPAGKATTLETAEKADPTLWMYEVQFNDMPMWGGINSYDYYLARGYAVIEAAGIGTYGSEGFELCGTKLERDSHKNVVEWLTGDRRAFTDRTSNIEIAADWSNGNVAMTGASYGGTLPFEVAATGVKGLKTIIPFAGIANWYDYTNAQGVPLLNQVHYADSLAGYNAGGCFLDPQLEKLNPKYGSWMWQIAQDQEAANGDYAPIWAGLDYTTDEENHFNCSALIVTGMNDFNVTTRHADLMFRAFKKAGKTVKLVLHQDGHNNLDGVSINGTVWQEIMNKWLAHYLFGVENDSEQFPEVLAQSNVDGRFLKYTGWSEAKTLEAKPAWTEKTTEITSAGIAQYTTDWQQKTQNNLTTWDQAEFYRGLKAPLAAVYRLDVPENTTIFGVPEVKAKLDAPILAKDGLMITAILMDVSDKGTFPAYMGGPDSTAGERKDLEQKYTVGGGMDDKPMQEYQTRNVAAKAVTYGWTDLQNPNRGFASSEYTYQGGLVNEGEKDYTFYMLPMTYTLAPGHHFELILTTWDPYRVFLDENFKLDPGMTSELASYDYSYTVNNESLKVILPVAEPVK